MESSIVNNDRATIWSVVDDGRQVHVPFAAELQANTALGTVAKALVAAASSVVEHTNANAVRLQKAVFPDEMRPILERALAGPVRALQSTALAEQRTLDTNEARLREIPNDPASATRRVEFRTIWRALSDVEKAQRLATLDLDQIQALAELPWSDTGTSEQFGEIIAERQLALAHIRLSGLQADHARQPSAADPLGHGPDRDACVAAAQAALGAHRQRREVVDAARSTLIAVVDAVGLIGGLDRAAAYDLLTSA